MQSLAKFMHKSSNLYMKSSMGASVRFFSEGGCPNAWMYAVKARVQHPAPKFEGMSWHVDQFKKISLDDYKGKYVVLFFYPLDFTFVCPTEIIEFSDKSDDFRKNGKYSYL